MSETPTVVVVEDDVLISLYLQGLCKDFGATVLGYAVDGDTALAMLTEMKPSHVLMDMRLRGEKDGVDVGKVIYKTQPTIKVIYITGSNEPETQARIGTDHPYRVLIKPINPNDLKDALLGE